MFYLDDWKGEKGDKGDKGLTDEEHQNLIDQMMQAEAINSQTENTLHAATLATTAANEAADSAWEAVDEINNALESISEEIVYFNYGSSTTYKMVDDAVKEGKFIVINYGNDKYLYKATVSNNHWFAQIGAQNLITVKELYLQSNNTWGTNSKTYATTAQIPTKVSQLSNDANYITSSDIPTQFIYYAKGDGTTAGQWHATIPEVTEYFEGLTIFYYINIAGASNTTLQINDLNAVKVYVNTTATGISTKYSVSSIIPLTYYEDADGTGSFRVGDYDTNTTYTINYLRNGYSVKNNATHPVYRYMLCGFTEDGLLNPISITSNNTTTTKKPSTLGFDPKQSLQYYQDTTTIAVNAHAATNTLRLYTSCEVRYSIQYASSFAADTPVYIKMKLGDDGLLYLPQSTADVANPIWHSTTIEDDDYYYWFIGNIIGTTAYNIHLKPEQPLYKYINGKVEEIDRHTMKPYSSYSTEGKELFKCTYGVTTYAEITQALAEGKVPYAVKDDEIYTTFTSNRSTCYYFVGISNDKQGTVLYRDRLQVNNADKWFFTSIRLAQNTEIPTKTSQLNNDAGFFVSPSGDPLHYMYELAGAEWNDSSNDINKIAPWGDTVVHKSKHWYLNGLGDITTEQMRVIYYCDLHTNNGTTYMGMMHEQSPRTNIPHNWSNLYDGWINYPYSPLYSSYEVVNLNNNSTYGVRVTQDSNFFGSKTNLKHVLGTMIITSTSTSFADTFIRNAYNIETIHIKLNKSLVIDRHANIRNESIEFMIRNVTVTTPITITLNKNAYDRAMADINIQSALASKTNVTLKSA